MELKEFKCRAECGQDVFQVLLKLGKRQSNGLEKGKTLFRSIIKFEDRFPDVECVLVSNLGLEELKLAITRTRVPDIHVMLETLQPIEEYTGERSYCF